MNLNITLLILGRGWQLFLINVSCLCHTGGAVRPIQFSVSASKLTKNIKDILESVIYHETLAAFRSPTLLPPSPLLLSSRVRQKKKSNHLPTWLAEETRDDDADYLSQFVAKCEKNIYFFSFRNGWIASLCLGRHHCCGWLLVLLSANFVVRLKIEGGAVSPSSFLPLHLIIG